MRCPVCGAIPGACACEHDNPAIQAVGRGVAGSDRRERIATACLVAIIGHDDGKSTIEQEAGAAVSYADALIAELDGGDRG